MNDQPRMVKLAELWERTSARGTRYFSGFMGGTQLLMFDGGMQSHPKRPDEMVHVWRLFVQEADPARRPAPKEQPRALPVRGQAAWDRARNPRPVVIEGEVTELELADLEAR